MLDRERKSSRSQFRCTERLSPRVLLPILGTRKMRVSEAERREREGERRRSNSRNGYAGAEPKIIWKQMRAILYLIRLLIGSKLRQLVENRN